MSTRITIPCRFSFPALWEPKESKDGKGVPKYQTNVLFDKTDKKTVDAVNKAIEAAKEIGREKKGKWKNKIPPLLEINLSDGDLKRPDDPAYAGKMYINPKSNDPVPILDISRQPIVDKSEFYAGCYGYAVIEAFAYEEPKNGISFALKAVMKTKDGDALGAPPLDLEEAFASVTEEDDEL